MARNVLVVSTVDHPEDVLREHIGDADTVKVVVPAVRQSVLDWLANDEAAYAEAEDTAARTAESLPGAVEAGPGEADLELAIRDALATFPADEILVAVHPSAQEGSVEAAATDDAPTRTVDGVPVRYLVVPE